MTHGRPFRFGLLAEGVRSREQLIETARRAESSGYSTLLIRDHFIAAPFGDQLAPMVALTMAAAVTTTLRIGTLVIDNDYRHPVMLAKEAATLDVLSNGRFDLGLGAGWAQEEYHQAGMRFDPAGVRIDRFEEALKVVKGLFAEDPLSFAGAHYRVTNSVGFPRPIQRPHPPIVIGAGGKRMLSVAGRHADVIALMSGPITGGALPNDPAQRLPQSLAQKVEWIRSAAGDRFDRIELSLVPTIAVTDDREQEAERQIRTRGWDGVSAAQVLTMPSLFIGSVAQITEAMLDRRERFAISYYVVSDSLLDEVVPIVARLRGT